MSQFTPGIALSLMAHPDDAEIFCVGTLLRLKKLGWEIHIATMTAGDCGTTTLSADQIMKIRLAESEAAARSIGATYHCVGVMDARIVYDVPTIDKVMAVFRKVTPTLVFTHPSRDYMMDHEMTASLARCATHIYASPNASTIPLRDTKAHLGIPHLYYADTIESIGPLGEPIVPTTLIDIRNELEPKLTALACHASQREWLRAHQGMDEYLDAVRRQAAQRGAMIGSPAAEGFIQHRGPAYPKNDLLSELLSKEN